MTWGICEKEPQAGAKMVTLSSLGGYIHDPDGVTPPEKIAYLVGMRNSSRNKV